MSVPSYFNDTLAILGRPGSGKSTAAAVIIESALDDGRRVIIIDPTGAHYGLRLSKDGQGKGYDLAIFGGAHGDIPIDDEGSGGQLIGETLGASNMSAIIDLSDLGTKETRDFAADFLKGLRATNRAPLHLVVDEADEIAPQRDKDARHSFKALDWCVRRGRLSGFIVTTITQRVAVLHKDILEPAASLLIMRLTGPNDRKAVQGWISKHGGDAEAKTVLASLAGLRKGEGWIWAPDDGTLRCEAFPMPRTFDSRRAPTASDPALRVSLPALDLGDLAKRLRRAEKPVDGSSAEPPADFSDQIADERAAGYKEGFDAGYDEARRDFAAMIDPACDEMAAAIAGIRKAVGEAARSKPPENVAPEPEEAPPAAAGNGRANPTSGREPAAAQPPKAEAPGRNSGLPKCERAILVALAQNGLSSKARLAVLSGYSAGSGGFGTALAALRAAGRISGPAGAIAITEAGKKALGPFEPLPSGRALTNHWKGRLGKCEGAIIDALLASRPGALDRARIAELTGYSATSGGYGSALSTLRVLGLIQGRGNAIELVRELR